MADMGAVTITNCSWAQVSDEFGGTPKLLRQRVKHSFLASQLHEKAPIIV
jgi:hypothetical protein